MRFEYTIEAGNFSKAGDASSSFKKILKQLNVDPHIIKRIVVSLYEGEVNIVAHAKGGKVICDVDTSRVTIQLIDVGPGIPDIAKAMQAGYSTASAKVREMGFGAGMGLQNIKNNADELIIKSEVGVGTQLTIIVNLNKA
ncbi:MAG: ATP-binding protein [Bacteroidales bacterium]|nr:ATP-binding protein [Bacteroidales bacterium]